MTGRYEFRRALDAENAVDVVGIPAHDLQETVAARGVLPRNRRLDQMARAVQLVPRALGPASAGLNGGKIAVEITVGTLVGLDAVDHFLNRLLKVGHRGLLDDIAHGFHPLGNVGIPENMRPVGIALAPLTAKRLKTAGISKALHDRVDGGVAVELLTVLPETRGNVHIGKGNALIGFHIAPSRLSL